MNRMNPKEIKTHPTFESLFPINPALLEKIKQDMRDDRYDVTQPIMLATWEGQTEPVCIDGHTRLQAARNAGIDEVPVFTHEFDTEQEAVEKAIKLQSNRRNMSDAEIAKCIEILDQRKPRGGDRRSEAVQSKRQDCPIENGGCSSAQETGDLLGISERKVRQARTVMDHADEATKEAVRGGEKSINQAYNETQKQRKSRKDSAQATGDATEESPSGDSAPEPVLKATAAAEESSTPQNDVSTSLGKRVTVYLPDWQYHALVRLCSGYVESQVRKAIDLYLESLGIREAVEDDDEEFFGPEDFEEE